MRYILQMKIKKNFKTQSAFSQLIQISPQRLSALIHGDRLIGREEQAIVDAFKEKNISVTKLFYNSK